MNRIWQLVGKNIIFTNRKYLGDWRTEGRIVFR